MKKVRKAVIPAAGLGTRVLPATKAMPKEMLPIVDKPAIQYIVEEAAAAGIEDILIITNRGKGLLEDHFDRAPELEARLTGSPEKEAVLEQVVAISRLANIFYVRQKETKGLGHAILCAKEFVGDEPFAVLYGDDVILGEDPACVYKTLVTQGSSKNYFVFVIPVAAELDLKAAARSVGEKSVAMIHVADINKVTGYVRGGCSPVGMKKQYKTVFDESVLAQEKVYVSGGRIGTQVCCAPADLIRAARATTAKIIF